MSDLHKEQQRLLAELRANGNEKAAYQAQLTFHDREMNLLSADVYQSAKHEGQPPPGWLRASEHPERLFAMFPQLQGMDIRKLLQPDESYFRAEIYLPDPAVLGPGYKPVTAFKGSAGQVMTTHGLVDTTIEDYLANNGPQAFGMQTDYYDRAMGLAVSLKRAKLDVDLTGHSLAGGMATAAAQVTGLRAVTFNAAGVHPDTARRFTRENPGAQLYDADYWVRAYVVEGDLLTHGVQTGVAHMRARSQQHLAATVTELAEILRDVPDARRWTEAALFPQLSGPDAEKTGRQFLAALLEDDLARRLRDLPPTAGDLQPPLAAKTLRDGRIVDREAARDLAQVMNEAGPLLGVLRTAAYGAHIGHAAGTAANTAAQLTVMPIELTGEGVKAGTYAYGTALRAVTERAGNTMATGVHRASENAASLRAGLARAEAGIDQVQGEVQARSAAAIASSLRWMGMDDAANGIEQAGAQAQQRNAQQAVQALREGSADVAAIRQNAQTAHLAIDGTAKLAGGFQYGLVTGVGRWADHQAGALAQGIKTAAPHAPGLGALSGGIAAGGTAFVASHVNPYALPGASLHQIHTVNVVSQSKHAFSEAFERHLTETLVPSFDAHTQNVIREIHRNAQRHAPARDLPIHDLPPVQVRPGISLQPGNRSFHEAHLAQDEPESTRPSSLNGAHRGDHTASYDLPREMGTLYPQRQPGAVSREHELEPSPRHETRPPADLHSASPLRISHPPQSAPSQTPPAAPPPRLLSTSETLQPGDRSAAVQALREHLRLANVRDAEGREIQAGRDYDQRTFEAVAQFQSWTDHEPTGIADPDTLKALQSQAQFALRQQGQGITIAPDAPLAEHLRPAMPDLADAAIDRPVQGRSQVGRLPFSDARHPQHALYADVQQRFQAKGHDLSEEHLSALTGQMHKEGLRPGWEGDVTVYQGRARVGSLYQTQGPVNVELDASTPSVQETMQAFQTQQQSLAEHLDRMNKQPQVHHSRGLS